MEFGKRTRLVAFALCILLCLSVSIPVFAESKEYTNADLAKIMQDIASWKKKAVGVTSGNLFASDFVSGAGSAASDWYAVGIGRTGFEDDYFSYLALLKNNIQTRYAAPGKLDAQKATEWHRISLAVLSLGGDPTDMGTDKSGNTIDLIRDGTYNRGKTAPLETQGINGYIWGLIALDAMRYQVPAGASDTRSSMILAILKSQLSCGGFTLDETNPDADVTAMALQALAPYYNDEKLYQYQSNDGSAYKQSVRRAADRALAWLSSVQRPDGDFFARGQDNVESTVQVMVALCGLGIDPDNDARFIKNGNSVLDGLMKYRVSDGGFTHSLATDGANPAAGKSDSMASEQALYALCALYRYRTGLRSLYDFRPEPDAQTKKQIDALNEKLKTVPTGKETVTALFKEYLAVPAAERCYIYHYDHLADAMADLNIANTAPYLVDCMDVNTGGSGTVTDILSLQNRSSGLRFNESDLNEYQALPKALTSEHYAAVMRLYEKLMQAENAADYADIAGDLSRKKDEVKRIRAEIESINGEIAEKLYPFNHITPKDKDTIYALVERAEKLSEYDRTQILGYEDLLRAKAKIDSLVRSVWITVIAVVLVGICVTALIVRISKKRRFKREQAMIQENEDW